MIGKPSTPIDVSPRGGDADPLAREARRLCDRYVHEVVLAFGLCPWAEPVLRAGALARHVLVAPDPAPSDCLPIIDAWASAAGSAADDGAAGGSGGASGAPPPAVEVGFVILPRRRGSRAAFDAFAEAVRRADRARRPAGAPVPFVIAAFHPEGAQQFVGPHQLVSFLRRTPDPLLQLVRADLLDRVTAAAAGVSQQIAERNFAALNGAEAARFDAVVRAIRADRDATYARLGIDAATLG